MANYSVFHPQKRKHNFFKFTTNLVGIIHQNDWRHRKTGICEYCDWVFADSDDEERCASCFKPLTDVG